MDSDEERENARVVQNQPYDEALEIPDGEEVASTYSPTPRVNPAERGKSVGSMESNLSGNNSEEEEEEEDDDEFPEDMGPMGGQMDQMGQLGQRGPPGRAPPGGGQQDQGGTQQQQQQQFNSEDEETDSSDEDDDDDDDDDEDEDHAPLEGAYDPADYENLPVTPEIKELFQYITRYTPQSIELEHKLKPFIPDFIPAVGDIDAFIKIIRPDSKPDTLGLNVLDEPCAKQSDPTVLDLQLRAISKQTTDKKVVVKSLESAEKNPKHIDSWIESIRELRRIQPPPNVHYSKNMPDIDTLMQEWPPEFEELLKEVGLPTAELDCDLAEYVDLVCSILDVPIYKGSPHRNERVLALHVIFTLFSEFKNSQHFRTLAEENKLDNNLKESNSFGGGAGSEDNRLTF
ncbi:intraflagellar transport protein 46 homolog [Ylistrum balloti]|uniref:intraflagellar transport protein 46 homolog n=1 Tax=Ylistrum balloti TaxID=509963 RepID=UPI002905C9A2|nr:intraflagellar transport protein 46 homolog [Ylistrum balloti]